ncbi:MAG TPA: GNAT family N-acetyltransferase [bacterium]|nr:GNAT family N-acetyltransferase [bacterium]
MIPNLRHPRLSLLEASDSDREFLHKVYASTRLNEMAATGWPTPTVDAFLRDQSRLQHLHYRKYFPQTRFQIVLVDGLPAGRFYVQALRDCIRLLDLALLPDFRGQGHGTALLKDLLAMADALALPLSLHVEINNPVRAWYRRLGFKECSADGVYCLMERAAAPAMAG